MMKKTFVPLLFVCLCACGSASSLVDDIDLAYYAHHVDHSIFRYAKSANVTIKPFGMSESKTYRFEGLIWSDDYYFTNTVDCADYLNDGQPLGFIFGYNSILGDEIIAGFLANQYWDCVSVSDFVDIDPEGRQEESVFLGRAAKLNGNRLSLLTQWQVLSFTNKTPYQGEGDEEDYSQEYQNLVGLICVSRAIYVGERLERYQLAISQKLYIRDDNDDGVMEFHDEVFDSPIDSLEYSVSFQ